MRRTIATLVAVAAAVSVVALAAETKKTTLTIRGMNCDGCVATVKALLKDTAGVATYDLSLEKATVDLAYDPEITDAPTIAQAIVKTGFQVTLLPWEPADASFIGCSNGFCGFRTPNAKGIVPQPGAAVGQKVYCPVSGVVLPIKESTLSVEIEGKPVYVCCEGCARYLAANRERVLALRGIDHAKSPGE